MQQAGETDLVRETARNNNHVRLGEVTKGPLLDWILTSGLTQEEVAMVQDPYGPVGDITDTELRGMVIMAENARLRAHFTAMAVQLSVRTHEGLETAMSRLGDRVRQAPPPM